MAAGSSDAAATWRRCIASATMAISDSTATTAPIATPAIPPEVKPLPVCTVVTAFAASLYSAGDPDGLADIESEPPRGALLPLEPVLLLPPLPLLLPLSGPDDGRGNGNGFGLGVAVTLGVPAILGVGVLDLVSGAVVMYDARAMLVQPPRAPSTQNDTDAPICRTMYGANKQMELPPLQGAEKTSHDATVTRDKRAVCK